MKYSEIVELLSGRTKRRYLGNGCFALIGKDDLHVIEYWGKILMMYFSNGDIHFYIDGEDKSKRAWRVNKFLPDSWNLRIVAHETNPSRYFLWDGDEFIEEIETVGMLSPK